MAKNITIAGASYTGVPAVNLQQTGGGTAKFVDTSGDTVTPETLFAGETAHGKDGEPVSGAFTLETEMTTQYDLIEQIKTALKGKAAGGSGGETYTVRNNLTVDVYIGSTCIAPGEAIDFPRLPCDLGLTSFVVRKTDETFELYSNGNIINPTLYYCTTMTNANSGTNTNLSSIFTIWLILNYSIDAGEVLDIGAPG